MNQQTNWIEEQMNLQTNWLKRQMQSLSNCGIVYKTTFFKWSALTRVWRAESAPNATLDFQVFHPTGKGLLQSDLPVKYMLCQDRNQPGTTIVHFSLSFTCSSSSSSPSSSSSFSFSVSSSLLLLLLLLLLPVPLPPPPPLPALDLLLLLSGGSFSRFRPD